MVSLIGDSLEPKKQAVGSQSRVSALKPSVPSRLPSLSCTGFDAGAPAFGQVIAIKDFCRFIGVRQIENSALLAIHVQESEYFADGNPRVAALGSAHACCSVLQQCAGYRRAQAEFSPSAPRVPAAIDLPRRV